MVSKEGGQWFHKDENNEQKKLETSMIRHYSSHGDNIIVAHNVQLFVEIL